MALINRSAGEAEGVAAGRPAADEEALFELVELLFFAYRDFISDPDEILAVFGFGRAHHRVLHFVARNPGMRVTELLDILKITKQSLGRVLRQLVEQGHIEQRAGRADRRQRLLYATARGTELARRLAAPQLDRVAGALGLDGAGAAPARDFLYNLIDETERAKVRRLVAGRGRDARAAE